MFSDIKRFSSQEQGKLYTFLYFDRNTDDIYLFMSVRNNYVY